MGAAVQTTFFADEILKVPRKQMPRLMTVIATEYANEVKKLMRNSPASGRQYGKHKASAPGEPPAPDTGDLVRSIVWRVRSDGDKWFGEVGSPLPYALYLEYGAAKGVRSRTGKLTAVQWVLYPRPAWYPALLRIRQRMDAIVKDAQR